MQNQENKKCSTQCFCDGSCKKQNTLSTRHKSRNGESHKETYLAEIDNLENYNYGWQMKRGRSIKYNNPSEKNKTEEDTVFNKDSEIHNCNWTMCEEKECNNCYPNKEVKEQKDLITQTAYKEAESQLGKKENKNKPQISLLFKQFPQALEAVAKCSEYGHEKYKEVDADYLNYQRVEGGSNTYADAGLRHRLHQGNDVESGLPHQYHVAWNALAELQLWINENKVK